MNAPVKDYVSPKAKEYQLVMESDSMQVTGSDVPVIEDPEE